jgi:hypothetical protein|tara:strand:- start:729 stop:2690 length:1962 start_codon:yes stop_codon:yes gene_type:complete
MWKLGTLTAAPFDWLEASYFYYRPSDLVWTDGDGIAGHDLDKGFNIKASYKPLKFNLPILAIGIDDLAGTGYFRREYIVSTFDYEHFKLTLGMGWGKYDIGNGFSNPLGLINKEFKTRNSSDSRQGGLLATDTWFSGNASLFGGIEWYIPKARGLKLKLENNPFNYFDLSAGFRKDASLNKRKSDSNFNFGLSMPISDYGFLDISFIKGNAINITYSIGATFDNKLVKKNKIKPKILRQINNKKNKDSFYKNLLLNLNNNELLLQTALLDEESNELNIAISSINYDNQIRSSSYAAHIGSKTASLYDIELKKINITNVTLGSETNKISYFNKDVKDLNNHAPIELIMKRTAFKSGNTDQYLNNEFKPDVNFPVVFQNIQPNLVSHVGAPQRFLFRGIVLQHLSEIQFNRNFTLTSDLRSNLQDNFKRTITGPGSPFLPHVRTDLVEYLVQSDNYISRMQLDYIWSPRKDLYAKISGGIFEMMHGGLGGEVLYKPFNSNFMIGAELYKTKKRDFNQKFKFLDYETEIGHINFNYYFDKIGIVANLSVGKYLAKDKGYTLDISRKTKTGFEAGIFFTRTNISAEEFGEGSFDKGFYFKIPFDLFSKNYSKNKINFKLRPLTRDGGAKLEHDKRLIDLMNNSSMIDIKGGWDGFLD